MCFEDDRRPAEPGLLTEQERREFDEPAYLPHEPDHPYWMERSEFMRKEWMRHRDLDRNIYTSHVRLSDVNPQLQSGASKGAQPSSSSGAPKGAQPKASGLPPLARRRAALVDVRVTEAEAEGRRPFEDTELSDRQFRGRSTVAGFAAPPPASPPTYRPTLAPAKSGKGKGLVKGKDKGKSKKKGGKGKVSAANLAAMAAWFPGADALSGFPARHVYVNIDVFLLSVVAIAIAVLHLLGWRIRIFRTSPRINVRASLSSGNIVMTADTDATSTNVSADQRDQCTQSQVTFRNGRFTPLSAHAQGSFGPQ